MEIFKPANKKISGPSSENPVTFYCHFVYKFLGRRLLLMPNFKEFFDKSIYNERYESILKKANLKLLPEEYFISVQITLLGTLILMGILSLILFYINPIFSVFVFYGGTVMISVIGIFMYNYPIVVAQKRGKEIDAAIPYLLPYMKILSKEINFSKIVEIIDDFLIYKEIKVEFEKIKYYLDFLGYDIQSSVREAMLSCPSRRLADMMNDLVTISNSGGDIYAHLERKVENMNQEIDALEKKNIDTLLILSQVYVVLLLIAPLFFTVMSAILNLINFSAETTTSSSSPLQTVMLILILLIVLPFLYLGFMMLVYYSKPLYSRLKPIKNV